MNCSFRKILFLLQGLGAMTSRPLCGAPTSDGCTTSRRLAHSPGFISVVAVLCSFSEGCKDLLYGATEISEAPSLAARAWPPDHSPRRASRQMQGPEDGAN